MSLASSAGRCDVSVVVPLHDERESLLELHARLAATLQATGRSFELVFVDDGSRDGSWERLVELQSRDPRVRLLRLKGNFGQTAALAAGFDHARGAVVISLDGDLQHGPEDIPAFLAKLDEGFDVVSGWRRSRPEPLLTRRLPSAVANRLLGRLSGVPLHDFGTTFKAYRREVLDEIRLYGDFHRFIPVFARRIRARIAEVPIAAGPRRHGRSNYGLARTWTVLFDLLRIKFLLDYFARPLLLFGSLGLAVGAAGAAIALWLAWIKLSQGVHLMLAHGPLLLLALLLIIVGVQFLTFGILGEMIVKAYYDVGPRRIYFVAESRGLDAPGPPG